MLITIKLRWVITFLSGHQNFSASWKQCHNQRKIVMFNIHFGYSLLYLWCGKNLNQSSNCRQPVDLIGEIEVMGGVGQEKGTFKQSKMRRLKAHNFQNSLATSFVLHSPKRPSTVTINCLSTSPESAVAVRRRLHDGKRRPASSFPSPALPARTDVKAFKVTASVH